MIHFQYFPEHRLYLSIFCGDITTEQLSDHISKVELLESDDKERFALTYLCDNAKNSGLDANDIISAGERMRHARIRGNGKHAIVARTMLTYGFARMYQFATKLDSKSDMTKVFGRDGLDDAIYWLGLDEFSSELKTLVTECLENNSECGCD